MTQPSDSEEARRLEETRRGVIRSRNNVLGLVLVGFAVLFFAITIAKMQP